MSWIQLPDDQSSRLIERLTKAWRNADGGTPSVIAILKHSGQTLRAVLQMNSAVSFGGSVLGRRREELISVSVSALNDCFY